CMGRRRSEAEIPDTTDADVRHEVLGRRNEADREGLAEWVAGLVRAGRVHRVPDLRRLRWLGEDVEVDALAAPVARFSLREDLPAPDVAGVPGLEHRPAHRLGGVARAVDTAELDLAGGVVPVHPAL